MYDFRFHELRSSKIKNKEASVAEWQFIEVWNSIIFEWLVDLTFFSQFLLIFAKAGCAYIRIMDEETYVLYNYIFFIICVLFWLTVFLCCLGPFIVWLTGEDEDGPVTLRESLRKSPYGQRPRVNQSLPITATLIPSQSDVPYVLRRSPYGQRPRVNQRLPITATLIPSQSDVPYVLRRRIQSENIH